MYSIYKLQIYFYIYMLSINVCLLGITGLIGWNQHRVNIKKQILKTYFNIYMIKSLFPVYFNLTV